MRHLLAVTTLTLALAGAGCSGDRPVTGSAAPSTAATPVAASGPVTPVGGNGPQVCAAAQQAGGRAHQTYVAEAGAMLAAAGASDSAGAEAARKRAEAALAGWRSALELQADRATDARLKTLLTDLAAEVGMLRADVSAIDETELERLQQRLDQLCAR